MENGSNKSMFEGLFKGADISGAQIVVVNESGGNVVYNQHAAPKGEKTHFPLDGTEAQGREVFQKLIDKKFIAPDSDEESFLFVMGYKAEINGEVYNCSIMVDEAHGLGVFGREGRGVCDHFGLTDEVDLIMGTFSKSLASIGGFIAGDADTINFLRHTCRTYIFSASDTPAATAAALEALHIVRSEPERIEALWKVTKYALKRFKEEGFEIGETESPIIPLYVRDVEKTFIVTARAFDNGVFINPVIPPACAPQDTLVRFALMATHTEEQVERGVQILKKVFKEQNIIK